jgi:tetratricopeptide (TPR) repeat protein
MGLSLAAMKKRGLEKIRLLELASEKFEDALWKTPDNPHYLIRWGFAPNSANQSNNKRPFFVTLSLFRRNVLVELSRCKEKESLKFLESAIEKFSSATAISPQGVEGWISLGDSLLELARKVPQSAEGVSATAGEKFKKAMLLHPPLVEAIFTKAAALQREGLTNPRRTFLFLATVELCRAIANLQPTNTKAKLLWAIALIDLSRAGREAMAQWRVFEAGDKLEEALIGCWENPLLAEQLLEKIGEKTGQVLSEAREGKKYLYPLAIEMHRAMTSTMPRYHNPSLEDSLPYSYYYATVNPFRLSSFIFKSSI